LTDIDALAHRGTGSVRVQRFLMDEVEQLFVGRKNPG
jgi:hypothetical protein